MQSNKPIAYYLTSFCVLIHLTIHLHIWLIASILLTLSLAVNSSRYETYGARNDYRGRGLRVRDTGQRGALLEARVEGAEEVQR